jgi:hypothetical protein
MTESGRLRVVHDCYTCYDTLGGEKGVQFLSAHNEAILMWDGIFTCIMEAMHALCWKDQCISYLQIVREWNECIGFADVDGRPSVITDLPEFIAALRFISEILKQGDIRFPGEEIDLAKLIEFLEECLQSGITVSISEL